MVIDADLKLNNRERAAQYAEYSLGAPVPLLDVVNKVVMGLSNRKRIGDGMLARNIVYGALRKNYPCKDPKSN